MIIKKFLIFPYRECAEKRWGDKVMSRLSVDLREAMPGVSGLTQRNIYYCKQFYQLYSPVVVIMPQAGAKKARMILPLQVLRGHIMSGYLKMHC